MQKIKKYQNFYDVLFKEFGVKDENALSKKLETESSSLPCCNCEEEKDFDDLRFIDGDPYCRYGCRKYENKNN